MSSTPPSIAIPTWPRSARGLTRSLSLASAIRAASAVASVLTLFLLAGTMGLGLYGLTHADRVYQGVHVAGIDLGGMTHSEAMAAVDQTFSPYLDQAVALSYGGKTYEVVPSAAGISVDAEATVDRAFTFGRTGSLWSRTQDWTRGFLGGTDLTAVISVDQHRLDKALGEIAPSVIQAPANAYIEIEGAGAPRIVPEQPGVAFDVGTTSAVMTEHLASRAAGPVPVVAPAIQPAVRAVDLQGQLAGVQASVASALTLSGAGRYWSVSQADLKRIVSASEPGQPVTVDRDAVKSVVRGIAKKIDHPAVDAQLIVSKQGELQVIPSEASIHVDVNASVDAIAAAITAGDHAVPLAIDRKPPAISDQQANDALVKAEGLVKNGLTLTWEDGSVKLGRGDLIAALTLETHPGEANPFAIGFSPEVIAQLLGPLADQIDVAVSNGRYRYVDNTVKQVEKGSNGRTLDVDASAKTIIDALGGGKPSAPLTVEKLTPKFSSADAKKIKLKDVLGTSSTYYGNSSDARRKNIEQAVKLETGWLVAPGDVFSYFQNIGSVDQKHGFVTGLGIVDDGEGGITTAPVVGGGICQVSTTIFQSAFWAGLAVVDRTAHPYWLQTYGQPPTGMKGLDAMVNIEATEAESIDMKFQNNTGNWIAVMMTADGENVTSQILGTNPGWTVSVQGGEPIISNIITPSQEMIYQDSPELAAGEEKQVESAQDGFDATIVRVTTDKDGNVIDEYTLASTYVPSVNRTLVGTGTSG